MSYGAQEVMPLIILREGDFEIWILDFGSKWKTVRCFRGEQEAKVLLLKEPVILRETDPNDVDFARKCIEIVESNLGLLLERWEELNS